MNFPYLFFILPTIWFFHYVVSLVTGGRRAKQMGFPVKLSPVNPVNPFWVLSQRFFLPLIGRLPSVLGSWSRYNHRGWLIEDKYRMHTELGDSWVHVAPNHKTIYLANPEACTDVMLRRKEFGRPTHLFGMLETWGSNIFSTDGWKWQQHRKIITPGVNERRSNFIWDESFRQAEGALQYWTSKDSEGVTSTHKDVMTVTFHILVNTGFGTAYSFMSAMGLPEPTFSMTYAKAYDLVRANLMLCLTIPHHWFSWRFLPERFAKIGRAITDLKRYMAVLLEKERQSYARGTSNSGNLLSALVHSSVEAKDVSVPYNGLGAEEKSEKQLFPGLTNSEILGDMFMITLGGQESTGNTLSFIMHLLSIHPHVQSWIAEEIQYVLGDREAGELPDYKLNSRLNRCQAVMVSRSSSILVR